MSDVNLCVCITGRWTVFPSRGIHLPTSILPYLTSRRCIRHALFPSIASSSSNGTPISMMVLHPFRDPISICHRHRGKHQTFPRRCLPSLPSPENSHM